MQCARALSQYLPLMNSFAGLPAGMMDAETLVWPTPVGAVWLHAIPFFRKVDFASRYNISTVWPYCQNQHECYVYSQPSNAEGPITINFPDGIAAFGQYPGCTKPALVERIDTAGKRSPQLISVLLMIMLLDAFGCALSSLPPSADFYLDLALDCVKETNKTVPCTLSAYTTQGDANIKPAATLERDVHSICDSPFVGQYFGLYADDMAADITGIGIHCEGSLPQVLGLVRIAEHPEKPVLSLQKPSQDQFLEM